MILNGLVLAASTTAARLAGTMGLFALAARGFGPSVFSDFAYAYAIGVLAGAISDYGFAAQAIKDCSGSSPAAVEPVARKLFTSKVLTSFLAFLITLAYLLTTGQSSNWGISALILFAGIQGSVIDFNSNIFKSRLCFKQDLWTTMVNSVLFNLLAGLVAITTQNIALTAATLVVGRTVSLWQSISGIKSAAQISIAFPFRISFSQFILQLKNGINYALDSIAIQGFAALDTLAAKHLLSKFDSGVYLTGTRLTQAALSGHAVISSVFMPSIGRGEWGHPKKIKQVIAMAAAASAAGLSIFLIFTLTKNWLPELIFGKDYKDLSKIIPYFGFYVFCRYVNILPTSWFTMNDRQYIRTRINLATFFLTALAVAIMRPSSQLLLVQIMCASTLINSLAQYTTWIIISKMPRPSSSL